MVKNGNDNVCGGIIGICSNLIKKRSLILVATVYPYITYYDLRIT